MVHICYVSRDGQANYASDRDGDKFTGIGRNTEHTTRDKGEILMQHVKFKLFADASLENVETELNDFVEDKDVINGKLCVRAVEYVVMVAYRDLADAEKDPRPRR